MVGGAYAPRHRWRRSIQVARLPSHSQGYCSTHESSPQDQTLVLKVCGRWLVFCKVDPRGQGPPGASRGRQEPPETSKLGFAGTCKGLHPGGSRGFGALAFFRGLPQGPPAPLQGFRFSGYLLGRRCCQDRSTPEARP